MKRYSLPILLAAVLAVGLAHAQGSTPRTVSRDELRVCMNSESALATRRVAFDGRAKQNAEEAAGIRAESQELAQERARLHEENRSMDRFERKVKAHNLRVQTANAGAATFRADLEAFNAELIAHNKDCGGIAFLPEDKAAILKEREPAKP